MTSTAWAGSKSRGFPPAVRRAILKRDPYCPCGAPSTEADHIIEAADGGTHDANNGRGMCHPCHLAKTLAHATAARRARPTATRTPEPHPGLT